LQSAPPQIGSARLFARAGPDGVTVTPFSIALVV